MTRKVPCKDMNIFDHSKRFHRDNHHSIKLISHLAKTEDSIRDAILDKQIGSDRRAPAFLIVGFSKEQINVF